MKGNRLIEVQTYDGVNPDFDEESYYSKIIFHELLHQAHPKKGNIFNHGKIAKEIERVTGQKRGKIKQSTFISQQINAHCPNAPQK